jgi:hypothetical protein
MRRFLTALIGLSILVMAQNVVAIMPTPSSADLQIEIAADASSAENAQPGAATIVGIPEPMSLVLLLTGISGLTAAGSRPSRKAEATHRGSR